jgi:ribosomal protein L14E/L6E/L27E
VVEPRQLGLVVHSLAGRDAGEYYLVVGILESNFVLVANGLNRPLRHPKKKNLRHLEALGLGPPELTEKLMQRQASDEEVVQAIHKMALTTSRGEKEGTVPDVKKERCN